MERKPGLEFKIQPLGVFFPRKDSGSLGLRTAQGCGPAAPPGGDEENGYRRKSQRDHLRWTIRESSLWP